MWTNRLTPMILAILVAFIVNYASCENYDHKKHMVSSFNLAQANISIWLSAAAYCDRNDYQTRTFQGPTSGFVVTEVIHTMIYDTTGYIGYLPSDSSIYVVFRGTEDVRNWMADLDIFKTEYTSYPDCDCYVADGFYGAEQLVISDIIDQVTQLKAKFPSYSVKVTGHSLGAALALLTAMDLLNSGFDVSLYNFGQPRVGDDDFSAFVKSKLQTWRVTHAADVVPHVPFTSFGYYHVCTEIFEDVDGNLKTCDSSCEDPTCSDQYAFSDTNVDDHLIYLGLPVHCDNVSRS